MATIAKSVIKQGKTNARRTATTTVPGLVKQGAAVAAAAGANPTAAEYLALLTSLRNAGIITT